MYIKILLKHISVLALLLVGLLHIPAMAQSYGNQTWLSYHWLGAHNAHVNTGESKGWVVANQRKSYEELLNFGVRVINLDVYDSTGRGVRDVYLCHGSCSGVLGSNYVSPMRTLTDALKRIGNWMRANPSAVVTVTLEDYVGDRALFDRAIKAAGVSDMQFNVATGRPLGKWPLLKDMVSNGKRLIILTSRFSNTGSANGVGYDRDYITENYWDIGFWGTTLSCNARWTGIALSDQTRAFHMSHFRPLGSLISARADNGGKLSSRMYNQCYQASGGRYPSIILLDYTDIGDGKKLIDGLNLGN